VLRCFPLWWTFYYGEGGKVKYNSWPIGNSATRLPWARVVWSDREGCCCQNKEDLTQQYTHGPYGLSRRMLVYFYYFGMDRWLSERVSMLPIPPQGKAAWGSEYVASLFQNSVFLLPTTQLLQTTSSDLQFPVRTYCTRGGSLGFLGKRGSCSFN
jgi:hypothetical protein